MNKKAGRTLLFRCKPLVLLLALGFYGQAIALPTGPSVVSGNASFNQSGNHLTVTNSNGAIINWDGFSIGSNESTKFIQSGANSSVLNRVVGNDPSVLLGSLQSNGKVFLINPAGIMVGQGARIDVAGFVASTLDIKNSDFLSGKMVFDGFSGASSIQNAGAIRTPQGGEVFLVAPQVINTGSIHASDVVLAAGHHVEIGDTASPGVRVLAASSVGDQVHNAGIIAADAGRIGIVGALIKNSGTLSASSAVSNGGKIYLKANSGDIVQTETGRIEANGQQGGFIELDAANKTQVEGSLEAKGSLKDGGTIHVLGDKVGLLGATSIDASGEKNGGTVLVGGDYQGNNPQIKNAQVTAFSSDAVIKANAGSNGNGGKVIVWSDDTTRASGTISTRGGSNSGNGGLVEVSGKRYLGFEANVDTRAPYGKNGTLLLDPADVTISNSPDSNGSFAGDDWMTSSSFNTSNISWATIDSRLAFGNVIITTSGGGTGNGDITILDGTTISPGRGNTLSLLAKRDIRIDANTGTPFSLNFGFASTNLVLVAGWDEVSTTAPQVGNSPGLIHFSNHGTGGLVIKMRQNLTMLSSNGINIVNTNNTPGAALSIDSAFGDITMKAINSVWLQGNPTNPVSLIANNGNINITGNSITTQSASITGNNVALSANIMSFANGSRVEVPSIGTGNITVNITGSIPYLNLSNSSTFLVHGAAGSNIYLNFNRPVGGGLLINGGIIPDANAYTSVVGQSGFFTNISGVYAPAVPGARLFASYTTSPPPPGGGGLGVNVNLTGDNLADLFDELPSGWIAPLPSDDEELATVENKVSSSLPLCKI